MHIKESKGFTVVEVLVAMTILVIMVGVAFDAVSAVLKARDVSRERLQAMELSQSVTDEIKASRGTQDSSTAWSSVNGLKTWLCNNGFTQEAGNAGVYDETSVNNNITYSIKVTVNSSIGIDGLFQLSVGASAADISTIGIDTRLRGG